MKCGGTNKKKLVGVEEQATGLFTGRVYSNFLLS